MAKRKKRLTKVDFLKVRQFDTILPELGRFKRGWYYNTWYPVKGLGRKKYLLNCYFDIDWQEYLDSGWTKQELVERCIEIVNTPPKPKKKGRRRKKYVSKFGSFDSEPYRFEMTERDGKPVVFCMLLIHDKKHRLYWGKGLSATKPAARQGRPPKKK